MRTLDARSRPPSRPLRFTRSQLRGSRTVNCRCRSWCTSILLFARTVIIVAVAIAVAIGLVAAVTAATVGRALVIAVCATRRALRYDLPRDGLGEVRELFGLWSRVSVCRVVDERVIDGAARALDGRARRVAAIGIYVIVVSVGLIIVAVPTLARSVIVVVAPPVTGAILTLVRPSGRASTRFHIHAPGGPGVTHLDEDRLVGDLVVRLRMLRDLGASVD